MNVYGLFDGRWFIFIPVGNVERYSRQKCNQPAVAPDEMIVFIKHLHESE